MIGAILRLRQTLRGLLRAPGFTLVALLTLALGIGATTAIYSLVYAVTEKALPYREPERLVAVFETSLQVAGARTRLSAPNFVDWQAGARTLGGLAAGTAHATTLTGLGEPERLQGEAVTWNHAPVWGLVPIQGRSFLPEEDQPGGPAVCLLSRGLWERRFGGDPSLVGRSLVLDGVATLVVGILPDSHNRRVGYWVPLRLQPAQTDRHFKQLDVVGRLREGHTVQEAAVEFKALSAHTARRYPELAEGWSTRVMPLRDAISEKARPTLRLLGWAVAAVLLLTCTNLANLLLARGVGQRQAHAVRLALGATPLRVARAALGQSLGLALAGGLLGVLLGHWGVKAFLALGETGLPRTAEVGLHPAVLGFGLGLSLLTGLAFGLLPALQAARQSPTEVLREGGGGKATSLRGLQTRSVLVVVQMALALVLLGATGLVLRSVQRLQTVDPGFRTQRLLTFQLPLSPRNYPDLAARSTFQAALLERLGALSGVVSVSTTNVVPLSGPGGRYTWHAEGRPLPRVGDVELAHVRFVGPGYFATLGIPVLQGRDVAATDGAMGSPVVFLSETMARRLWPGQDPLGRRLCLGVPLELSGEIPWMTVAGVVGDVRQTSLDEAPGMAFYVPSAQDGAGRGRTLAAVLRTEGPPGALAGLVRGAVRELDPSLPLVKLADMEGLVQGSLAERRVVLRLLGAFSLLALALTAVGVYGLLGYNVAQRTRELGIRAALGAGREDLMRLVLRHALTLALTGLGLGILLSLASDSLVRGLVVEAPERDLVTLLVVALGLLLLALLAALLPALRASRIAPSVALRAE